MSEKSNMNKSPVIKCESVYKIFGNNAEKLLKSQMVKLIQKSFMLLDA
jgi:hypothetical protein